MDSVTKSHTFNVPKIACFEEWLKNSKNERNGALFAYISKIQDISGIMEDSMKEIKTVISRFSSKLSEKWEGSHRTRERFMASNKEWLQGDLTFTVSYDHAEACCSSKESQPGPGRPTLNMENASAKSKRRRVDDLISTRSSEELLVAAEISSRLSGKRNVAKLIKEVSESPDKLIITSDPLINSLRETPRKKTGSLPLEVLDLLISPEHLVRNKITVSNISEDYCVSDSSEDEDEHCNDD